MQTNEEYEITHEEEDDYSNFYNVEDENDNKDNNDNKKNKIIIIAIIAAVLLIVLAIVLFLVFRKKSAIDFNLNIENKVSSEWVKDKATINVEIPDETNLKSIKYTINCTENCDYVDVVDKKILISNNGTSVVSVIVTNVDDVENKKDITVKIDNVVPELSLSPADKDIKSSTPVTVCAVCHDNESGCKQEKVCKEYSKTSKNQTLTIEDNVGNTTVSSKFNVTISGGNSATPTPTSSSPSCSLSVNKNGLVTATYKNANSYHGFSSNYSGSNSDKKQVTLEKNGEKETVKYYVKNSAGKTATCSIEVVANNCVCLYRADENGGYKCYKTFVKTINDPNSSECKNAQNKTNTNCSFYKDEGMTCSYSKK